MADAALIDHRVTLKEITSFPSLVSYLRDEMGWPIDGDDLEDLSFDYTADELGIEPTSAAKIQEIKRLRPLSVRQPWGIFFVMFEPKRLPVVALRRILSRVVLKKRDPVNKTDRPAWQAEDLLFVSNFGDGDDRQICFAHFTVDEQKKDLPTLKVLGWDNLNTPLRLDHVAERLTERLAWPDDEKDVERWRGVWRSAFTERHREVITTSKILAERLAKLARDIRVLINEVLVIETEDGPITKLMKAFREALVHDLDANGFADMYAQTIAYGLLSARIADPKANTADDFAAHIRTSPFLRELMEVFLHAGGRNGTAGGPGIDFDELGVSEVVALLDAPTTNMEAILRDFGDRKPEEDPVIHFYELFLKEYDAKKRTQRGVFYTPLPVVSYIVRSVHERLQTEFGLPDGLADTATWGDMAGRHPGLTLPEGVKPTDCFVTVLDPATGTGTFLVEAIEVIHCTMVDRWTREEHSKKKILELWNEYVPRHLLPRLHGYELMMAPYAIAHVKIGLKLHETGYRSGITERARVYLTNSLEPPHDFSAHLEFAIPALAHEATAVNAVKRSQQFTVVIGNPPYSIQSGNLSDTARSIVDRYRFCLGMVIRERGALQFEKNLQNDYVKFIRYGEGHIIRSGIGVLGYITSHAFLTNRTLRGMRESLLETFPSIFIYNLHGNAASGEAASLCSRDENVFEITEGVAISVYSSDPCRRHQVVKYADLAGRRDFKYQTLLSGTFSDTAWHTIYPAAPNFIFKPQASLETELEKGFPLDRIFTQYSAGIITARDEFATDENESLLIQRAESFATSSLSGSALLKEFGVKPKKGWDVDAAKKSAAAAMPLRNWVKPYLYRPFDTRFIAYNRGIVWGMAFPTLKHTLDGRNSVLIAMKQYQYDVPEYCYVFVARGLTDHRICVSKVGMASLFPLYLTEPEVLSEKVTAVRPNFDPKFVQFLTESLDVELISKSDGNEDMAIRAIHPDEVFCFIYAQQHSRGYRKRYAEFLRSDYPHIFFGADLALFRQLAKHGGELIALHLVESPVQRSVSVRYDQTAEAWRYEVVNGNCPPVAVSFKGPEEPVIGNVAWSDDMVWIDAVKPKKSAPDAKVTGTIGFRGVPEEVWNFHIGGYQVCEKWLKDRKGRALIADDITHYHRIVIALHETIRIMRESDEVIEAHGGWPAAFASTSQPEAATG